MIIQMSPLLTIIIDIAAWLVIHVSVSIILFVIPAEYFNPESCFYRKRVIENNGKIYERIFKIKNWKKLLPDGAAFYRNGFRKKKLENKESGYVLRFIQETCRAEITHIIVFLFAGVFFIWNEWWIGIIMIVYAALVNIPCILAQRYNRIRLLRLYSKINSSD
jgi:glycosyl-4,4'-diaponeurosporenoate acyltransferase